MVKRKMLRLMLRIVIDVFLKVVLLVIRTSTDPSRHVRSDGPEATAATASRRSVSPGPTVQSYALHTVKKTSTVLVKTGESVRGPKPPPVVSVSRSAGIRVTGSVVVVKTRSTSETTSCNVPVPSTAHRRALQRAENQKKLLSTVAPTSVCGNQMHVKPTRNAAR
jgi:hypothetical protein